MGRAKFFEGRQQRNKEKLTCELRNSTYRLHAHLYEIAGHDQARTDNVEVYAWAFGGARRYQYHHCLDSSPGEPALLKLRGQARRRRPGAR